MSKNQINMTEGPVLYKLLQFSIPLIFSSVLQLLFNAADLVVVGKFAGDEALAAVGSTGSLINLLINVFTGLSIGTNVVAANYYGAKDNTKVQSTVNTAMLLSIFSGLILTIIGMSCTKGLLTLMGAPFDVLKLAALYLKIYFGGITATMVYNFGSALLRAKGDTKRPLYILFFSGLVNVVLNLIFVIFLNMSVAGVGIATVISQIISAGLVVFLLVKENDEFHLDFRNLAINKSIFLRIVKIGLPAGFQGIMFSFSNVIIQSSINGFGKIVISGSSAASNLEGFIYTGMNGFSQGALTFCSQNLGAKKFDRIKKVVWSSQLSVIVIGVFLSTIFLLFGKQLLGLYTKNPEVVEAGMVRLWVILTTYFLCGVMDSMANTIRGIGHSLTPVITSLVCVCLLRIVYLMTFFQIERFHSPITIYFSYPFSWILAYTVNVICYIKIYKKIKKSEISNT